MFRPFLRGSLQSRFLEFYLNCFQGGTFGLRKFYTVCHVGFNKEVKRYLGFCKRLFAGISESGESRKFIAYGHEAIIFVAPKYSYCVTIFHR